jgi:hypothetical protein
MRHRLMQQVARIGFIQPPSDLFIIIWSSQMKVCADGMHCPHRCAEQPASESRAKADQTRDP